MAQFDVVGTSEVQFLVSVPGWHWPVLWTKLDIACLLAKVNRHGIACLSLSLVPIDFIDKALPCLKHCIKIPVSLTSF